MAIIFIGSMVVDQLMRYALPVENTGDGKAALLKSTTIVDEEVNGGQLSEALRSHAAHLEEQSEESYEYISSEATEGGVKIVDNTEGRELSVENLGKKKRRSHKDMGLMQIKVLYCTS